MLLANLHGGLGAHLGRGGVSPHGGELSRVHCRGIRHFFLLFFLVFFSLFVKGKWSMLVFFLFLFPFFVRQQEFWAKREDGEMGSHSGERAGSEKTKREEKREREGVEKRKTLFFFFFFFFFFNSGSRSSIWISQKTLSKN